MTYKDSDGYSYEYTYDEKGNVLTHTRNGKLIFDNRQKVIEVTLEDLEEKYGCKVKVVK